MKVQFGLSLSVTGLSGLDRASGQGLSQGKGQRPKAKAMAKTLQGSLKIFKILGKRRMRHMVS